MLDSLTTDKEKLKKLFLRYKSAENIIKKEFNNVDFQKYHDKAEIVENNCLENYIKTITLEDQEYPSNLRKISNPPAILYLWGERPEQTETRVAIVGSRKASEDSLKAAQELSERLYDNGIIVVSGMANGIDTAGHKGALTKNKKTIAVLGESLIFGKRSKIKQTFIQEILDNGGCVLTEVQPFKDYGSGKYGFNLKLRNRITTGLSKAVIIGECRPKSGTLNAVRYAKEQNKPVYSIKQNGFSSDSYFVRNMKDVIQLTPDAEDRMVAELFNQTFPKSPAGLRQKNLRF
jgi:DNA processing protein